MTGRATGPVHLRWQAVLLVAIGGAAGTAARAGITLGIPSLDAFPIATFLINVAGAFLLGMLLSALAGERADENRALSIRLLAGTGFLGGFTTYSALATDTVLAAVGDSVGIGLTYAVGTLVLGGVATWAGIIAGAGSARRGARR